MEKKGLDNLPVIPMPDGYTLRSYRPGDEEDLARIYEGSDLGSATAEKVRANVLGHPCFRPERILVVEREGQVVGTAAAWSEPTDPGVGYLHMVGVLPEHQGKRLGKLLTVEAIRFSRNEGYDTQRLVTDDWRDAAIRLYLDLGYIPLLTHPTHRARWEALGRRLNRPTILEHATETLPPPRKAGILARLFRALGF
jgi:mycothiol synthase